jgi:HSP20 family molecular chaperone IbpA
MKKISTNKLLSLLIVFALLLGLFPPVMLTADAATVYRWDHIINADSAYPYRDDVNSLYIWAYDDSFSNRTLSSDSGWLKISGGSYNLLIIEKSDIDMPYFNNEIFNVKIKSVSGTESVTVKFLDNGYNEISSQTVTATVGGAIASLSASSDVYSIFFESMGEFSITDMTFGIVNTSPSFLGSSDLYLPVSSSSSWDIKNLVRVSDTDALQTLTWTVSSAPSHGSLVIDSATASSGSSNITPGGSLLYQPTANYTGNDSFAVQVSDGIDTVTKTINVTVIKKPLITTMANDYGISGDYITKETDITFNGNATANSTIEIFKDEVSMGTTTTSSSGSWSYGVNPITEGTYSFMYSSTLGGVTVFAESERIVVIDTTAPNTPVITSIDPDTGNSSTDRVTSTNTFTVHGTADANSYVEIFESGSYYSHGSAITDSEGNWSRNITTIFTTSGGLIVRAMDIAGNLSIPSSSYAVVVDTTAPTFTLSSTLSSPTNQSPIPISVVFTEAVTGFDSDDITVTNATKENFASSDNITYTMDLVPTAQGDITVSIPVNAAYDLAGNGNSNSSTITVKYDNIAPTVEITSTTSMDTNIYEIPVKIMFSEDVTGFALEDIVMSNATPKADSFEVVSAREYNVIADAQTSGQLVTVDVAAGVAFDSAGNGNTEATQFTRRYDRIRPFSVVTSPDTVYITDESPIPIVITFYQSTTANETESVTGFDLADIIVINGTAGNLTGSGHIYYADITPDGEGIVDISIIDSAAQDAAGNPSRNHSSYPSLTRVYDVNPPSVNISSSVSTTNTSPIPVTFTFSEAVTGFTVDDISVSNGSLSNFIPVNGYTYTVDLTPSGQGQITVDVAADVAIDAAGNFNTAAAQLEVVYDTESPSVNISSSGSATNISPIPVTFTFSEAVIGFTSSDIAVTNGTLSNLNTVNNIVFTADITPSAQGNVRINISSARATDVAGNNNTAASEFTIKYDTSRPSVSIYSTAPAYVTSAFNVNIQFSEEVTGFELEDLSVTNGTPSGLTTADNRNYAVTITPTGQGTVTINVATNAAFDAAGNGNSLVMGMTRVYDSVNPTVTIDSSLSSYTNISPIPLTITFSEAVTGFTADDITVANGTKGVLSGSGSTYTIDITPFAQGAIRVNISSAVAIDIAGNSNTAASEFVIGYDTVAPVTTIDTMQLNMDTNDSTDFITKYSDQTLYIVLTHRLSLTEFVEISMDNGVTWTNFGHAANSYSSNNNITLLDGTHNIKLRIVDLAGNIGPVTTQQYTLDTDIPTVQVTSTVSEPTNQSPIPITITFSEDVIGMQLTDLLIENGTASSLLGSGNIYTAQITPTGNGIVRLRLGYGSVMDAAANAIETSSYYTWTYDGTSPTVEITSTETTYTKTSPIPITITFSEAVTGLTADDFVVTNATKGILNGSGNIYTMNITPISQGNITVNLPAGAAVDATGNTSRAASEFARWFDSVLPTVVMDTTATSLVSSGFRVDVRFSEDVTGFTIDDIQVTNANKGVFSGADYWYRFMIYPINNGQVTVEIPSGVAADESGNMNTASSRLEVTYDNIPPTVDISSSVSRYTSTAVIPVTIEFSEAVPSFTADDIIVTNGTKGILNQSGNIYTIDITAVSDGTVSVEIEDWAVTDTAGNYNQTSVITEYVYDSQAPVIGAASSIRVDAASTESISFSWGVASDNVSSASNLLYKAYYSTRDDVADLADVLSNGTAVNDWSGNTSASLSGLTASSIYYINVLVKDEIGNMSAYSRVTAITDDEDEPDADILLPNNTVITIDGKEQEAANIKRETTKGKTTITVTVNDDLVNNLIKSKDQGTVITLPATGFTNEVVGQLNGQTIKNMEQINALLEIKTDKASYSLPADQINIDDVSKALGSSTNLEDIKVKIKVTEPDDDTVKVISDSAEKGKLQLMVEPVEFTITCETKEKTFEVSKFKGYVERRIAIPDGVDPADITTAVVLNEDGTLSHVPTRIVKEDGRYYAVINSLTNSTYTLIYRNVEMEDIIGHWAAVELNDMASRLVIQPDTDGNFSPDDKITRAQFARFIVKALGLVPNSYESIFTDVADANEDSVYIEKAYEYGIINGYGNGLFGPSDLLTREQSMAMLERAMKLAGMDADMANEEIDVILDIYTDKNKISEYAVNSVAVCIKNGIVIGRLNDDIDPQATLPVQKLSLC